MPYKWYICFGPEMREHSRKFWKTCWCFKCRQRLDHYAVFMVPVEASWYGPHYEVQCERCGEDHVHFPGTWDGPTLEVDYGFE